MTAIKAKNGQTIQENVIDILKAFPAARNNDRILFAYYWALIDEVNFDGDIDDFIDGFQKATPPSSIQRSRQMINYNDIHEAPLLPTDPKILELRVHKASVMKEMHNRMKIMGGRVDG